MNELLNYIKERSSMSGCNINKWNCNTFEYCDVCLESQIKEHDKRIREQTIGEVERAMYHQCFEVNNDEKMQKWDGGNWFRYKLFENVMDKLKGGNND